MLDLTLQPEQLLTQTIKGIGAAQADVATRSEELMAALSEENAADAAFQSIKFSLTLEARTGRAEAELGLGKITESMAEAWVKTRPEYVKASEARDAAQFKKWAAQQAINLAENVLKFANTVHYAALAILNKDTKLALAQA
ncbi:MAG: hypothetical protein FWH21_00935 [Kiritimatiellaeota bacterium]|nr:hypothetical protein [Kiritimatiellota bacterium]